MRKISVWAKHHRPYAIASIIAIKISLAVAAYFTGSVLSGIGIQIPVAVCLVGLITYLVTAGVYPGAMTNTGSKKQFYLRQKSCDLAIGFSTFIMIGTVVNSNMILPHSTSLIASNAVVTNPPTAEEILASLEYRDKKSLTKKEKRILKQEFKKQLKVFAIAKITGKKSDGSKALLIILTIIGALGLLYLLAALSCSISCSGAEGAAIALALVGTIGIVWATIAIIRRISRGPRQKPESSPKTDQSL